MNLSIGHYTFRLEIVILIAVVAWILFGHLLYGCCNVTMAEGLQVLAGSEIAESFTVAKDKTAKIAADSMNAIAIASKDGGKEGFTSSTTTGPEFSEAHAPGYIKDPSTWAAPSLTYSPGTTPGAGVESIWERPKQPIPLPKGELDMFATTEFKPECCPNTYSNSTGCACMTVPQYDYLKSRGSNNVPYSEY